MANSTLPHLDSRKVLLLTIHLVGILTSVYHALINILILSLELGSIVRTFPIYSSNFRFVVSEAAFASHPTILIAKLHFHTKHWDPVWPS
jgi:hypothetical protein